MAPAKVTPIREVAPTLRPQAAGRIRKRVNIEPRLDSVRNGIFGQWLNGDAEELLADRYGCRVLMVRTVIRAEAVRMREELRRSREMNARRERMDLMERAA